MKTFTLKCQYTGRLQITRGLTEEDLRNPRIFRACSHFAGGSKNHGAGLKYSSGRFVTGDGNYMPLTADPLFWPDGHAVEVGCSPINRLGEPLLEITDDCIERGYVEPQERRQFDAFQVGEALLEGIGQREFIEVRHEKGGPVDWNATFDPAGVNAVALRLLDRADWKVEEERPLTPRKEGVVEPVIILETARQSVAARWTFSKEMGAVLSWHPGFLILGCVLRINDGDRQVTDMYDTVSEALQTLVLEVQPKPGSSTEPLTIRDLIRTAKDSAGRTLSDDDNGGSVWRHALEDVTTIYRTR